MNVTELSNSLCVEDKRIEEIVAPASAVEIRDGDLRIEGRSFGFGPEARKRMLKGISAPAEYLGRLTPATQDVVASDVLKRGDCSESVSVALLDGDVYTVCRGDLLRLRKHEVVGAVIDALGANADSLSLTRIANDGDMLDLDIASPRKSIDVQRGDTVQAGFHISHSIFGDQATVVEMFTYRLICTNGMIHRSCPSQGSLGRTRKLPVQHAGGKELQIEQIRRVVSQAWEGLEPILTELRATRERKAEVENLLTGWLQRARISTSEMMPRLREAWQEDGGENTQYGAINALTRVATHGPRLSSRQRRALSSLAGLLAFRNVHICPRCFTVLSQGTTRGEDS
jgi:hypothetical protein